MNTSATQLLLYIQSNRNIQSFKVFLSFFIQYNFIPLFNNNLYIKAGVQYCLHVQHVRLYEYVKL